MRRLAVLAIAAMSCGRINFVDTVGDAGGDGGGDGAVDLNACNGAARIFDDFEDGIQDAMWATSYAAGTSSYSESGGDLVLTLAPNAVDAFCGYSTGRLY